MKGSHTTVWQLQHAAKLSSGFEAVFDSVVEGCSALRMRTGSWMSPPRVLISTVFGVRYVSYIRLVCQIAYATEGWKAQEPSYSALFSPLGNL